MCQCVCGGGGVGGVVAHWKSIGLARRCHRLDSPVRQGIFLPESTFSADFLTVSVHPPCAIACIYICAHVKDPKHWQTYLYLDTRNYRKMKYTHTHTHIHTHTHTHTLTHTHHTSAHTHTHTIQTVTLLSSFVALLSSLSFALVFITKDLSCLVCV